MNDYLKMFEKLPRLDITHIGEKNIYVTNNYYFSFIPTLYFYDDEWVVDWNNTEDGSIKAIEGDTIEEAISKAYAWCIERGFIK